MNDKDIIFLETRVKELESALRKMTKAVLECVQKFDRPELIVPELVEVTKRKNGKKND
jgi:hypothetical protein